MEVVHDEEMLRQYVAAAVEVTPERPILIDRFLENALECEADALSDGTDAFVPAVMEHIELAGIHSRRLGLRHPAGQHPAEAPGDDRRVHPAHRQRAERGRADEHAVRHRERRGLRAGGQPARLAHRAAGLQGLRHPDGAHRHAADAGHEARRAEPASRGRSRTSASRRPCSPSTCSPRWTRCWARRCAPPARCWAWPSSFGLAFFKAEEAAKPPLPTEGTVLITVNPNDRPAVLEVARQFHDLGFSDPGHARHARSSSARTASRRRAHQQAPRGPAQHHRRHHQPGDPAGDQHAGRPR